MTTKPTISPTDRNTAKPTADFHQSLTLTCAQSTIWSTICNTEGCRMIYQRGPHKGGNCIDRTQVNTLIRWLMGCTFLLLPHSDSVHCLPVQYPLSCPLYFFPSVSSGFFSFFQFFIPCFSAFFYSAHHACSSFPHSTLIPFVFSNSVFFISHHLNVLH